MKDASFAPSLPPAPVAVEIVRAPGAEDLPLPAYETPGAVGMDLRAAVDEPVTLAPGETRPVSVGIRVAIPPGYEAQVRPRSGLAARSGVTLLNSPGTLDPDFRGIVHAVVINHGREPFTIRRGDRIAQIVVAPVARVAWREVESLDVTGRGVNGFGSTGAR
jgi:dUTP pyrophosphatase